MMKIGSLPWDERGFDEVVDGNEWNLGFRMKDYWYIVLIEGQFFKNSDNINDNEGKPSDEVVTLG